ncbi:MAG: ribosome biogenesis GTP-binding protein YihA/YsxC [Thermoanaerobaculaceae bacterium]
MLDPRHGPREPLQHVAFAGRSNVGKSSLLNRLWGHKLAQVSKTPGRTRTLNFYLVNGRCFFVDLPGYGYAAVDKSHRQQWGQAVTQYLLSEPHLQLVVALLDPRVPPSPLDQALFDLCRQAGRNVLAVLTKADRVSRTLLAQVRLRFQQAFALPSPPLVFSAKTGEGKRELLGRVAERLAVPLLG